MQHTDFLIVGAGIAGSSLAAELAAAGRRTLVLERELHAGYHSTGRSAAIFSAAYGSPAVRALSRASLVRFLSPPSQFDAAALTKPRGLMLVAADHEAATLDRLQRDLDMAQALRRVDSAELLRRVPLLRPERAAAALYERDALDIDVGALHQAYLRAFRASGGTLLCNCEVLAIDRARGAWMLRTSRGDFAASILVDAAGAWADSIACMAGVSALGIVPKRRTALLIPAPKSADISQWPLVVDLAGTLYFKPEAGKLLLSPMDESPQAACDVQPDELDVAIAVERFEQLTTHVIDRVSHQWAGLRSFTSDEVPVIGFDPCSPNFFWLAGQGGFGIQTAPAAARTAAALIEGRPVPPDVAAEGITEEMLSPRRLRAVPSPATSVECRSGRQEPQ
jgi:D-arginine dehydrogenase